MRATLIVFGLALLGVSISSCGGSTPQAVVTITEAASASEAPASPADVSSAPPSPSVRPAPLSTSALPGPSPAPSPASGQQTLRECLEESGYIDALEAGRDSVVTLKSDLEASQQSSDPFEQLAGIQLAFLTAGKSTKTASQRLLRAATCGDDDLKVMTTQSSEAADAAESELMSFDVTDDDPDPRSALDAQRLWSETLTYIATYIQDNGNDPAPEPFQAQELDPSNTKFADVNQFADFLEAHDVPCPGTTQMTSRRRDCSDEMVLMLYSSPAAAQKAGEDQVASICEDGSDYARLWVGNGLLTLPEIDLIPMLQALEPFGAQGKSCLDM